MKKLKVWFPGWWGTFDCYDNVFTYALSKKYDIEITPDDPDLVVTGFYDNRYQNAKTVYFSGEPFYNIGVNDYALTSFYVDDPRYFRFPLFLFFAYEYYKLNFISSYDEIIRKKLSVDSNILQRKTNFCAYVSRGPGGPQSERTNFFNLLSQYKKVDSMGMHLNNAPCVPGESATIEGSICKCKVIRNYKFTMAFENTMTYNDNIGYTTEKIYEPMIALSVPIYWGNPDIHKDFNTKSFVNWNDYGSNEKAVERIIEIDNDDDLYMDYIKENYCSNEYLFTIDYLVDIFDKIIED
jgi:hypothetical protein